MDLRYLITNKGQVIPYNSEDAKNPYFLRIAITQINQQSDLEAIIKKGGNGIRFVVFENYYLAIDFNKHQLLSDKQIDAVYHLAKNKTNPSITMSPSKLVDMWGTNNSNFMPLINRVNTQLMREQVSSISIDDIDFWRTDNAYIPNFRIVHMSTKGVAVTIANPNHYYQFTPELGLNNAHWEIACQLAKNAVCFDVSDDWTVNFELEESLPVLYLRNWNGEGYRISPDPRYKYIIENEEADDFSPLINQLTIMHEIDEDRIIPTSKEKAIEKTETSVVEPIIAQIIAPMTESEAEEQQVPAEPKSEQTQTTTSKQEEIEQKEQAEQTSKDDEAINVSLPGELLHTDVKKGFIDPVHIHENNEIQTNELKTEKKEDSAINNESITQESALYPSLINILKEKDNSPLMDVLGLDVNIPETQQKPSYHSPEEIDSLQPIPYYGKPHHEELITKKNNQRANINTRNVGVKAIVEIQTEREQIAANQMENVSIALLASLGLPKIDVLGNPLGSSHND
jgi:hypothetical protein